MTGFDDLVQSLRVHKPTILHFSGHATAAGFVVDGSGDDEPLILQMPIDLIGDVLEYCPEKPRCVVFNACDIKPLQALEKAVEFVVGMEGTVRQNAAITFAYSFYSGLARGAPIGPTFKLAAKVMQGDHQQNEARPWLGGFELDKAATTVLTRQPAISADFLTDAPGVINREDGSFGVRLRIRNAPPETEAVVWQLPVEKYGRSDEFDEIKLKPDFPETLNCWEDIEVKASIWGPGGGLCLRRNLLEALKEAYPCPAPPEVGRALDELEHSWK